MSAPIGDARRYVELGVSATKADVFRAIQVLSPGIAPNAFCKVMPDIFEHSTDFVTVAHSDGAGSKSILAYIHYRLTGSLQSFRNIAQDAIVMNLDDLICVGATSGFLLTSIVNRNAYRISGDVLQEIIFAKQQFTDTLRPFGIDIQFVGGETADVGDVVRTILVDANMASRFPRGELLINQITPGLSIIGLGCAGAPTTYESEWNSGIGCNGITFARHSLLGDSVRQQFPEIYDPSMPTEKAYTGPFAPFDNLPNSHTTVLEASLSPTRTFAPVIRKVLENLRAGIHAIVHNTGGAHTKCLRFAQGCIIEKDLGSDIPAIFTAIRYASQLEWPELAKMFNLGYRMELYCDPSCTSEILEIAASFAVPAFEIGRTTANTALNVSELHLSVMGDTYHIT